MDENELRLDYWVATRTNPKFPLWVIFKEIGHRDGQGEAYGRRSLRPVREMLRDLEDSEWIPKAAEGLAVPEQELRAALWYAIWLIDQKEPPSEWKEWNDKVDEAWRKGWR